MENKIYFDKEKNIEIHDVSGNKNIEDLKSVYAAPGLEEITQKRADKIAQDKAVYASKEALEGEL